ncbi:MAG: hypothetical protein J0L97_06960 [Alphaproteobacteria bacterium]|nr:hypothetical protein [Alphaproteobacteria bacterium]
MNARPPASEVKVYKADTRLRDRVGGALDKAFNADRVAGAEKVLVTHQKEFEDLAATDTASLVALLPQLKKATPQIIKELRAIAFRLKSNAGTFGYPLAGQIAKSLFDYAEVLENPSEGQVTVLEKHIELLAASFREGHAGNPQMQQAILGSLQSLAKKFPAA